MATAPPPPHEGDDTSGGISDAAWQKFMEENGGDVSAGAPKEPSARARMVTERLRREDAAAAEAARKQKSRWRRAKEPREPAGWRTGPVRRETRRGERRSWRRGVRTLLVVVAVAVVTVVALNPSGARSLVRGQGFGSSSDSAANGDDTPLAPETARPTAAPDAVAGLPTVSHPFAGSPALKWADGADGLVAPHAKAVGDVPAQQVAAALQSTKAYLVGTNLDPAVLRGGSPAEALRRVDPRTGVPGVIRASISSPSEKTTAWVTRYDPTKARLVGTVIKVRGRMTFAAAEHGGVRVHTDATFVYAFTNAHHSDGTVRRLLVRRVLDTYWYPGVDAGKVQIGASNTNFAGAACDYSDGFLHPEYGPASPDHASGPATDPYDRSKPLSTTDKCGVASRV